MTSSDLHTGPVVRVILLGVVCSVAVLYVVCSVGILVYGRPSATSSNRTSTVFWSQPVQPPVPQCDLAEFKRLLDVDSRQPVVPRHLLANCSRIIYNKSPKCGSSTVMTLLQRQAERTGVHFWHPKIIQNYTATDRTAEDYTKLMLAGPSSFLVNHFYFRAFPGIPNPVYINVIREPTEWLISLFYYQCFGTAARPTERNTHLTLESWINSELFNNNRLKYSYVHMMCGQEPVCGRVSEESLKRALENSARHFLLLGFQENITAFAEVLEYLMPHLFSGLVDVYNLIQDEAYNASRTDLKKDVSAELRATIKDKLQLEGQFYNITQVFFNKLYSAILWQKQNHL